MHNFKLAVTLPGIQFALAAVLLHLAGPHRYPVPTSRLICAGLNAPAQLFAAIPELTRISTAWLPGLVYGFEISDLFFLVGVLFVWYLVGQAIDSRNVPKPEATSGMATALVAHVLLLAVGGLLLYIGLFDFREPTFGNLAHRPYRGILTLLWAGSLLFISSRGLLRVRRRGFARSV